MRRYLFITLAGLSILVTTASVALAGYPPTGVHSKPTVVEGLVVKAPPSGVAFTGTDAVLPLLLVVAVLFVAGAAALAFARRFRGSHAE